MKGERSDNFKANIKFFLIPINILIIVLYVFFCFNYVQRVTEKEENSSQMNFGVAVSSMQKLASSYIVLQQESCNNWASFINLHNFTMQEALRSLETGNSVTAITMYIIDYETFEGIPANIKGETKGLSFAEYKKQLEPVMRDVKIGTSRPRTHITPTILNPLNSTPIVGFCNDIEVSDGGKHYMLMKAVPISLVLEQWLFPSGYESAELSLIAYNGDYIIRSASMEGENFWDAIKDANGLIRNEVLRLKNSCYSGRKKVLELKNASGEDGYYSCVLAQGQDDWAIIGYIPKFDIENSKVDFTLVLIVFIGFFALLLIDGISIFVTNVQLAKNANALEKASLAKTNFLSSMSHDIRTPMNAIIGMTEIASRSIDDKNRTIECLDKIKLASNHLLTLINDILDISKIESGKFTLNPVKFYLPQLFENLINMMLPQIRAKKLELSISTKNIFTEEIFADELRLNQIFINLLSNAVKYTSDGGKISIKLREDRVGSDKILLTYIVSDTGIGMSPDFQKRMYDSFARAVDTRVDKISGTGLGLAIVKQMTELMGGTIECKSALGKGTTFTIKIALPFVHAEEEPLVLPKIKVLVISSNEGFVETVQGMLIGMGVLVDVAENAKAALGMLEKNHGSAKEYIIAIIDQTLPDSNAVDLTFEIRKKISGSNPVILISGYDNAEIEDAAKEVGANGFLSLPLFRTTLHKKINDILEIETRGDSVVPDDYSDLAGMKVIVAEDNELNWEILHGMLSFYKVQTFHAENGLICLDMIGNSHSGEYDAIFMDIQMPVMNGRDAAKSIRALEDKFAKRIPIFALTADAFAEDVQACKKAGMNGHIAKPVELKKVQDVLRRVRRGEFDNLTDAE